MSNAALEAAIEAAWDARDTITPATKGETRDAIEATLTALDSGKLRVAEKRGARQPVGEKGGSAVVSAERYGADFRRQWRLYMVGQGSLEV